MTQVGRWFWAAACAALLSGCTPHPHHGIERSGKGEAYWQKGEREVAELIAKSVSDNDKAARATALMKQIIQELKASREQSRALHRQLYELNADYAAPPEDFTKILDQLHNGRMRSSAKVLALRFQIKEQLSAEEWKSLSAALMRYGNRYMNKEGGAEGTRAH